jgi:hypothetical protein
VSGSTGQYSGADFAEFSQLPNFYLNPKGTPLSCAGRNRAGPLNLRNSILAAEVIAARRMLLQLNPETTRVGVITFGDEVWLRQPLTHNFDEVRNALDIVYKKGPYGGTNMVDAIGVATEELLGRGESEKYLDSIKALFFSPMASLLYQRQTARRETQTWPLTRLGKRAKRESTFMFLHLAKRLCPILGLLSVLPGRAEVFIRRSQGRPMFWL